MWQIFGINYRNVKTVKFSFLSPYIVTKACLQATGSSELSLPLLPPGLIKLKRQPLLWKQNQEMCCLLLIGCILQISLIDWPKLLCPIKTDHALTRRVVDICVVHYTELLLKAFSKSALQARGEIALCNHCRIVKWILKYSYF